MLIYDIIAALESEAVDPDYTAVIDSTPLCLVCVDHGHRSLIFFQKTSLANSIRT